MTRPTKEQVDHMLQLTEQRVTSYAYQHVLAAEVRALREELAEVAEEAREQSRKAMDRGNKNLELREEHALACQLLKTATVVAATHLATIARVKALCVDMDERWHSDSDIGEVTRAIREALKGEAKP